MQSNATVPYFTSKQVSNIYNFPTPQETTTPLTVAVISFGGGLVGTVSPQGVLNLSDNTSDIQAQWTSLGISPSKFPKVIIVPVSGATNAPNPSDGATIENTIDVQTIGAMCPSPYLTIILYIAPNSFDAFTSLLHTISNPITIDGTSYIPSIVSCSWGAPETYYPSSILSSVNSQLQALSNKGVIVTVATGDNGSSDGTTTDTVDYPSSSQYVLACGGTSLVCPNYTYDSATQESTWSSGGGGVSVKFPRPSYQSALSGKTGRSTPDISLVADPNTGVVYIVGGKRMVIGGTSIVAPAMAAFFACINVNKFVTPILYTLSPSNYHDITTGSNGSYTAKVGYDNCTGFGSIQGNVFASSFEVIPIVSISLTPATLDMNVGTTSATTVTYNPTNSAVPVTNWVSSNTAVASVNSNGLVSAVGNGTAVITASVSGVSATRTVTVSTPAPTVTGISLAPATLDMNVGTTSATTVTFTPVGSDVPITNWVSSNTAVATVNSSGLVSAVGNGTAVITASVSGVSATRTVTVSTPAPTVTGISLAPETLDMNVGTTSATTVTFSPVGSDVPITNWVSSNTAVATVNSSGLVSAVGDGTAVITASVSGVSATRTVTVSTPIVSISLAPAMIDIKLNTTSATTVTFNPTNSAVPITNWASNNTAVATVNSSGLVTGVRSGTAVITATVSGISASRTVIVSAIPVTSIVISPRIAYIRKRLSTTLNAVVLPRNASNRTVTWSSSNTAVLTVDNSGKITAISHGIATITATCEEFSANMRVEVY